MSVSAWNISARAKIVDWIFSPLKDFIVMATKEERDNVACIHPTTLFFHFSRTVFIAG